MTSRAASSSTSWSSARPSARHGPRDPEFGDVDLAEQPPAVVADALRRDLDCSGGDLRSQSQGAQGPRGIAGEVDAGSGGPPDTFALDQLERDAGGCQRARQRESRLSAADDQHASCISGGLGRGGHGASWRDVWMLAGVRGSCIRDGLMRGRVRGMLAVARRRIRTAPAPFRLASHGPSCALVYYVWRERLLGGPATTACCVCGGVAGRYRVPRESTPGRRPRRSFIALLLSAGAPTCRCHGGKGGPHDVGATSSGRLAGASPVRGDAWVPGSEAPVRGREAGCEAGRERPHGLQRE